MTSVIFFIKHFTHPDLTTDLQVTAYQKIKTNLTTRYVYIPVVFQQGRLLRATTLRFVLFSNDQFLKHACLNVKKFQHYTIQMKQQDVRKKTKEIVSVSFFARQTLHLQGPALKRL